MTRDELATSSEPTGDSRNVQATESLDREDGCATHVTLLRNDALVNILLSSVTWLILVSTMKRAKSVEDISQATGIPKSTCYEKMRELLDNGILRRERILITRSGMRCALYKAAVKSFRIKVGADGTEVAVETNEEESDCSCSEAGILALKSRDASPRAETVV